MSDLVKRYTSSVFFDKRLWQADIEGSLAHAEMLAAQGILSRPTTPPSCEGMAAIRSRDRGRPVRVEARPGRRTPQHRGAPDATGR
jgi:argininosuccinate lyase